MMDDDMEGSGGRSRALRRFFILTFVGLAGGLPSGWVVGKLLKAADVRHLPWSDEAALFLALFFAGTGLVMALLSANRKGRAILQNVPLDDDGRPERPEQRIYMWLQTGVLVLAGLMLAAPVVWKILSGEPAMEITAPLMIAIIIAFVCQSFLNFDLWKRSDELQRGVIEQSGALSFWFFQGAFFLWACGEQLRLLPAISSWDAVTLLMTVYLAASSLVAYRRGLAC